MPRDLAFLVDTLDARVQFRGILDALRRHPEVAEIAERVHPQPPPEERSPNAPETVRVFLRNEGQSPSEPWLSRLFREHNADLFREPPPSWVGPSPQTTQDIISRYLANPEGRARIGQSMAAPLRQRMDYQSIGRRTFLVEQLPDGALPGYDRDPMVAPLVTTGWDGNGSPVVPEKPIPVGPLWARHIGQWIFNKREQEWAQIVSRRDRGEIQIELWRHVDGLRWHDPDYIYENWEPCKKPEDPKPIWDRLLQDDFF